MQPGVVSLTDCKSKLGTVVNGKKLAASQKIELDPNDVLSFGQGPSSKFKYSQYLSISQW